MLSTGIVPNSPNSQQRQLMMRADGRCYVFPRTNTHTVAIANNGSDFEEQPVSRTYQYRKVMKPMLERKRRARINRCLDELKELMLTALQSEGENVSKLEKADILELTVRHLHKLKRQRALRITSDSDRFLAGFTHCAAEVSQYFTSSLMQLRNSDTAPKMLEFTMDQSSGVKLLHHLQTCIQRIETASYRQNEDSSPNPYSTPPSSPSPNSTTFLTIEAGENYVSPLSGGPVWRPW